MVAMSVLMTNFSTEQLIGLNGDAFRNGAASIAWEAFGAIGIVVFVCVFLPRYYARDVTTIPQYVESRCGHSVRRLLSVFMLISISVVGLPFILYSGTVAMVGMFNLTGLFGLEISLALFLTAVVLGGAGLAYTIGGGMRGVAVSNVYYAVIYLLAAIMVPVLGLCVLGEGNPFRGVNCLIAARPEAFNPFGLEGRVLPPSALLTGMVVINLSAWCANQSAAQKAFAASSLAAGQKGMLMAAAVKLFAPLFFVLPGMIGWALFKDDLQHVDMTYAALVHRLLPSWLVGLFAVAIAGATITSVTGLVHSATTLYDKDLCLSKRDPNVATLTRGGRFFALTLVLVAIMAVPVIAHQQTGFYVLMKRLNATLTIPVVAVVVVAVLTDLTWRRGVVKAAMGSAIVTYLAFDIGVRGLMSEALNLHWLHSVAAAFAVAVSLLLVLGRKTAGRARMESAHVGWRYTAIVSGLVLAGVVGLYLGLWGISIAASR